MNSKWRKIVGSVLGAGVVATAWADRTLTSHITLTEDTDWRGEGTITLASNVVVNLNGHTLRTDELVSQGTGAILNHVMSSDYEPLESVTSSGENQFIDTQLTGKNVLAVRGEFSIVDKGGNYVILGVESPKMIPLWISGTKWYVGYNGTNVAGVDYTGGTERQLVFARIKKGEQNVWANGVNVVHGTYSQSFNAGTTLYLFARHSGSSASSYAPVSLYFMDIFQDATISAELVRSFVPARCVADGAVGVYDVAHGTFYSNGGKGVLTAGPVVSQPGGTGGALFLRARPGELPLAAYQRPHDLSIDVTVDLSGSGLVPGDRIFAWSTPPKDMTFHLEGGSPGVPLVSQANGLYYGRGTTSADAVVWQGGAGEFSAVANWRRGTGEEVTSLADTILYVPPTSADEPCVFSYPNHDPVSFGTSVLSVMGTAVFPTFGGFSLGSLEVLNGGRLVYDPVSFTFRLKQAPTFEAGAKFALPATYATATKGRFLLLTWDAGTLQDPDVLTSLFDTTCTQATAVRVWAETTESGGGRLWLDLDAKAERPRLNVLALGDSTTQGSDAQWGNWRTLLMKRLEAAGYDVRAKGYWKTDSADICGATMPSNWVWHAGEGSQALITRSDRGGYLDAIENVLDQAGDVDVVFAMIGVNDINHYCTRPEVLYPAWTNFVGRILRQKPQAKVVAGSVLDMAGEFDKDELVQRFNALMSGAVAGDVFPAHRVAFADLYTACYRFDSNGVYIPHSFIDVVNVHPDWLSEDKIAATYCATFLQAVAADPAWTSGTVAVETTTDAAEDNVPAAYRNGFTRARVYDAVAHSGKLFATNLYEDATGVTAATENLSRVGYYIVYRRRNTETTDYHGAVRYMWLDVDAFGGRTLDDVGIPIAATNQCCATRLHIKTNMPGIDDVDPADDSVRAWIEFWPLSYRGTGSTLADAPTALYGHDWNDSPYHNQTGDYGSMQIHRLTPGGVHPAQVLFAFNGWCEPSYPTHEFGFGNLALFQLGGFDWTFTLTKLPDVFSKDAYEMARIEIWTRSVDEEPVPAAPQIASAAATFAAGSYEVTGELTDLGLGGGEVSVALEWARDAAFETVEGRQEIGAFSTTTNVAAAVAGLDAQVTRYFRWTAQNAVGVQGTSDVVTMDAASREVVRAVWTNAAGDGDVTNAQNWSCENAMARSVVDALPTAQSVVQLSGAVAFNVPRDQPVVWRKVAGACTLAADCDWRGLTATFEGTVDLMGHNLTIASLDQPGLTITDSTLTAGYRRLESITATGTQFIDTGVPASSGSSGVQAEADVMFNYNKDSNNFVLLGATNGSTSFNLMWLSGEKWWMIYSKTTGNIGGVVSGEYGRRYHIVSTLKSGSQTTYVDGTCVVNGSTGGSSDMGCSLTVFGRNYKGSGTVTTPACATLYAMKIWKDGVLVRDFVPAQRVGDEAIGLLNVVDGSFYTNNGQGVFVAGAVCAEATQSGELHLDVPAGSCVENTVVSLTGSLRLVKDGEGAYIANKAEQSYRGGTVVAAGEASFGAQTCANAFGAVGAEIRVLEGASLNFAGSRKASDYAFVFAGGRGLNTVEIGGGNNGIAKLTLEADTVFDFYEQFNFKAATGKVQVDLKGHKLEIRDTDRWYDVEMTEGTLTHSPVAVFHVPAPRVVNAPNLTLDEPGMLFLENGTVLNVSNYVARSVCSQTWDNNGGTLNVFGTFTPVSDEFWGCVLQDGATLDLSGKTDAWSTTSLKPHAASTKTTVTFADEAAVMIDLKGRFVKNGEYVVTWVTPPTNLDTLTFTLDAKTASGYAEIRSDDHGLYIYRASTVIILR